MEKAKQLGVEFVVVDNTKNEDRIKADLDRSGQKAIPVNLIYPPNYPAEPAVLLREIVTPADALKALSRMEEIQNRLHGTQTSVATKN